MENATLFSFQVGIFFLKRVIFCAKIIVLQNLQNADFFLPIGRMPRLAFSGTVCIMLVFSLGSQSRREQMRYFSPSKKPVLA